MIKEKVKTGVPGLDQMLDGGLLQGRTYIVSGTSGSGKTTLAMQFLLEGAKNGERVLYMAIDEPPNEVKSNLKSFGWDVSRIQVFDATPDVMSYDKTPVRDVSTERKVVYFQSVGENIRKTSERSPVDMTVNTIQEILKQEMKVSRYTRIVVDSLTSMRYFYIKTSEENAILMSFLRLLSDIGVTCIVTVQLPEISKPDVEAHVARGEIRLHKWFDGRGLMRGVTIEKYRGSAHDYELRQLRIGPQGITVKIPSRQTGGEEQSAVAGSALQAQAPQDETPPPPDDLPPATDSAAKNPSDSGSQTPSTPEPPPPTDGGQGI
jgi:KaiC/GvpD/RAD55 family RecA-like ATPase